MSANLFGLRFQVMTFGESHGPALGVVIDGCPSGVIFDHALLESEMGRRRPGQGTLVSARAETDHVEVLSGIYEGKTLGTPLAMIVRNEDARSSDYAQIASRPRVGHADDVWLAKFGHRDHRGGGRSSGRETVSRVMAGAVAKMVLREICPQIMVKAWTFRVGGIELTPQERDQAWDASVDEFPARFPSESSKKVLEEMLARAKENGDSLGGSIEVRLRGVPCGWGQPVFHKLKADLAAALMGVGATSGVEFGAGSMASSATGSEFHTEPSSSVYGGIRGGLSTGDEISMQVHFKPTSSIGETARQGRHDPLIVTRAVPVVEAMVLLVLADHALWARTDRALVTDGQ